MTPKGVSVCKVCVSACIFGVGWGAICCQCLGLLLQGEALIHACSLAVHVWQVSWPGAAPEGVPQGRADGVHRPHGVWKDYLHVRVFPRSLHAGGEWWPLGCSFYTNPPRDLSLLLLISRTWKTSNMCVHGNCTDRSVTAAEKLHFLPFRIGEGRGRNDFILGSRPISLGLWFIFCAFKLLYLLMYNIHTIAIHSRKKQKRLEESHKNRHTWKCPTRKERTKEDHVVCEVAGTTLKDEPPRNYLSWKTETQMCAPVFVPFLLFACVDFSPAFFSFCCATTVP